MDNYCSALCNKCLCEVDLGCRSRLARINIKTFLCKKCKKEASEQSKERICPKCNSKIVHSSSGSRKNCEGKICRKCKSNQIPKEFTQQQLSFFNGLMLGDGSLVYGHKTGSLFPRLCVQRQNRDKDYVFWQYYVFKPFYGTEPKYFRSFHNRVNKFYDGYASRTKSGEIFKTYHQKWYVNHKKIVPRDLILDPLTLLIWFLDDGCIVKLSEKSLIIKFSTDGFSIEDVLFLRSMLESFILGKIHIYKNGNGFILRGCTDSANKIIKIIEPIFPDCMVRKKTWL
jgi:hypothetical protein